MQLSDHILAIDTSSRLLSVAVRSQNGTVFEANLDGTPRHSEQLIDLIANALKTLHLKKEDIHTFLWGLGPGSFTGLRIGLSALKGFYLGFGGKKRALGASSLDVIALGSGLPSGELLVCVDARRERIYTAIYRFQKGKGKNLLKDT